MNIYEKDSKKKLKSFYTSQIEDNFWPYWEKFIDEENGGVFTCINNNGDEVISKDKYSWSQGRFLWLLSYLYDMSKNGILKLDPNILKEQAYKLKDFILLKCIIEDEKVAFITDECGNVKKEPMSGKIDASIYADCFVIIGLAAFSLFFNDKKVFKKTYDIYKSVIKRINKGKFNSEPYPIPQGLSAHPIPMILVNVESELLLAAKAFNLDKKVKDIETSLRSHTDRIMKVFAENNLINEFISEKKKQNDLLLCKHKNPGHAIESMWFIIEAEELLNKEKYIKSAEKIIINSINIGWDKSEGGLLRFVDSSGGKPTGEENGDRYEKLILDTWDMKLWWPHSETLYALLLLNYYSEDIKISDWFEVFFNYTYSTFPNTEVGEWIQIRKRNGEPEDKLVALPVKDPFHIMRFLIKSLLLLDKRG
jgi:N-acylglucosamine 2-epimerase